MFIIKLRVFCAIVDYLARDVENFNINTYPLTLSDYKDAYYSSETTLLFTSMVITGVLTIPFIIII